MAHNLWMIMRFLVALTAVGLSLGAAEAPNRDTPSYTPHWTRAQVVELVERLNSAPAEGLDAMAADVAPLRAALASQDWARIDQAADQAAIHLLIAERRGCCHAALRTGWQITSDQDTDPAASIANALANNSLTNLFNAARPSHPWFLSLLAAYGREKDARTRAIIAANLDRWRWMPRRLGERYLLVNTAAYEATLWQDGAEIGRWRVVVGKSKSPTPVFAATITGVIFNPWWEIPSSIVAESVGALVRHNPAEAARRGYVVEGGRYRQRPGDGNALGRMKLVMPNPYSIYLHDTPSKGLFSREVRAFSHGCVRVADAIGLASALLAERPGWTRQSSDAMVAAGETQMVPLARPIPVYIAYFTAQPNNDGLVRILPDIYGRDRSSNGIPARDATCDASGDAPQ